MKPSFYNYRTALPDGTTLLFNFYTLKLVALKPGEAAQARLILENPEASFSNKAQGLKDFLIEKGLLIDDSILETEHLRHFHGQSCKQGRNLSLTILPTLSCNFRCTYCYERKNVVCISKEVEEAILKFTEARLPRGGNLAVTWFGGEPLLRMDTVERLSLAFMKICTEKESPFSASIITNGYLLTKSAAEKLVALKIKNVQVTLDGPPFEHDRRRPTIDGRPTFKRIFENIKASNKILPIHLRINVDHSNRGVVSELIETLVQEGLQKSVHPYLGHTYPYTEVCNDVAGFCLTDEDFSLLELEIDFAMAQKGFSSFRIPQSKNTYCLADNQNAFVITPSGGIVNCWNDAANPEKEIGHLLKPDIGKLGQKVHKWSMRDPFELECIDCILLPICMGGCPYLYQLTGKLHCHDWKHHLDEKLAFYYYIKEMQKEGEISREFYEAVQEAKKLREQ